MKKFKIKIKILVYGFPAMVGKYVLDNFELKSEIINDKELSKSLEKNNFNTGGYITSCSYKLENDDNLYYNYFENIYYIEIEIPNKKAKDIPSLGEYILLESPVHDIVEDFAKKMRLVFNLRIIFPIYKTTVYNEHDEVQTYTINYNDFPASIGLMRFDKKTFEKNSNFGFDLKSFKSLEKTNVRFSRAVELFSNSFEPSKISLRFLMLFSALESLFITSKKDITEQLAICVSRILLYDNPVDEINAYERIKKLYDYRSKYVHGKKVDITLELEKELREYVRDTLIIYWIISFNSKYTSNVLIKMLKSKNKFSLQNRLTAKYLRTREYKRAYREACEIVAEEIEKGNVIITEEENGIIKSVMEISEEEKDKDK